MAVSNYRRPAAFYVNNAAQGRWLKVRLRGRTSNRDGVGATVTVSSGDRKQLRVVTAGDGYASQFSRVQHFGLGKNKHPLHVQIQWPSGVVQNLPGVASNQLIEVDELNGMVQPAGRP